MVVAGEVDDHLMGTFYEDTSNLLSIPAHSIFLVYWICS